MTQKDKELLLKDLCARLPYDVKVSYYDSSEECECIDVVEGIYRNGEVVVGQYGLPAEIVKPYLFPLSSMTEKQKEELLEITDAIKIDDIGIYYEEGDTLETYLSKIPYTFMCNVVTWCYKNHLDINNLIPLGLAIDATSLNIY